MFAERTAIVLLAQNIEPPQDLSAYEGLELRVKGNGARFKLVVRDSPDSNGIGYTASFDTVGGVWQSVSRSLWRTVR